MEVPGFTFGVPGPGSHLNILGSRALGPTLGIPGSASHLDILEFQVPGLRFLPVDIPGPKSHFCGKSRAATIFIKKDTPIKVFHQEC